MNFNRITGPTNRSIGNLVVQNILRTVVSLLITFIIFGSITFIAVGMTVSPEGYRVLYSEDEVNFETVYEYRYTGSEPKDWVDEKLNEYMDKEGYYKETIPGQLSSTAKLVVSWISQIFSVVTFGAFIYIVNWNAGNAAADKNELGGAAIDKNRGFKAGLLSVIPFAATYLLLVIEKLTGLIPFAVTLFEIANFNCFALVQMMITGGADTISYLELVCLAAVLLPLPLIAGVAYRLGVRHIIIKEKIVYQNDKSMS